MPYQFSAVKFSPLQGEGAALAETGQYTGALACFAQALRLHPPDPAVLYEMRAQVRIVQQCFCAALRSYSSM
jgi:hypothetical protein